jgi:hypothetical protein
MLNLGGILKHVNSHPLTLTLHQKIYSLSFKSKGHQWSCHLEAPGAMGWDMNINFVEKKIKPEMKDRH